MFHQQDVSAIPIGNDNAPLAALREYQRQITHPQVKDKYWRIESVEYPPPGNIGLLGKIPPPLFLFIIISGVANYSGQQLFFPPSSINYCHLAMLLLQIFFQR